MAARQQMSMRYESVLAIMGVLLEHKTVDMSPIEGPLRFYVAEDLDDAAPYLLLVHRSGAPVLGVHAEAFRDRLSKEWLQHFEPESVIRVLYELVPPLCEGCGQLVLEDRLCSHCHHQQVQDLLAIAEG